MGGDVQLLGENLPVACRLFVSFSGGKDSTILLDLVRDLYPDVPAAYADTGAYFHRPWSP